jgi:3D (Asp-Asp-Asp) domain-containing protein/septal ring factor EnvC (AmiA/AmiB activator)
MRGHASQLKLAAAAVVTAAVVLAPTAAGDPAQALRQRDAALAAKSRAAVLSLYAIESQLARARTRLDAIRGRADALRRERRLVAVQLDVARRGVATSQGRLAKRLRSLYERGDIDPLAIVLGADSLDTALTGLDSLGQMANGDRQVVHQLHAARDDLNGLQARLAVQQRTLDGLVRAAAATTATLESSRATRASYVSQLASERRLTRAAIDRIAEQARAARLKAETLEFAPEAAPVQVVDAAPTAPAPDTAADPPAAGGRALTVSATGYALGGTTATGLPVGWGVAAVDPSVIPLGTRLVVPGYGEAVAADIGGAVHGNTIDLWFPSVAQAQAWGRRTVTITLR